MKNKPITVYISEGFAPESVGADWSFLYPKPTNLFSDLSKERAIGAKGISFLTCPAFSDISKKTIQYKSPMSVSYEYDFTDQENLIINPMNKNFISFVYRDKTLEVANTIFLELRYYMFADEPLEVMFTSPYFSQSKYTRYATVVPGKFDIGRWFRPFNLEVQPWSTKGEIHIEKDEPLFYAQFQTDRDIKIQRFSMNEKIKLMASACVDTTEFFGRQSLLSRYNMFDRVGLRGKLLTEINKNLIEDW